MACKPKSQLRMSDGGTLMKRFAARQPVIHAADGLESLGNDTQSQFGSGQAVGAPTATAPVRTVAPMGMRSQPQAFQPMAVPTIGPRNGGDLKTGQGGAVPGTGTGDKIPALYESGEFVVSNAMLDAAPQLRDQLHDLRGNVLAAQGKSVAETDAAALGYDGPPSGGQHGQENRLRQSGDRRGSEREALSGQDLRGGVQGGNGGSVERSAALADDSDQDRSAHGSGGVRPLHQVGLRALDGFETTERPWNGAQDARTFAQQPGPGNPVVGSDGSPQAKAFQQARSAPVAPAIEPPIASTPKPTLRTGLSGQSGALSKSLYAGGRAIAPAVKLAGALGPLATGAGIVSHFGDYKLNEPGVDSSFVGNVRDIKNGDFGKAWDGFKKGAVEAGMDMGSFGANTLDYVAPGKAPVSTAYHNMLRGALGDQLMPHSGVAAQAATGNAATAPVNTVQHAPNSVANIPGQDAEMPGQDPGRVTLQGQGGADVGGAPGVSKFVQNGKTLYSNVAGGDNDVLMNGKRQIGVAPAMDPALIKQTMTNPDGSAWSANDNATMAANLRDGADPYRGTSRQAEQSGGRDEFSNMPVKIAAQMRMAKMTNSTALRGQDMDYKRAMAPIELQAKMRAYSAQIFKAAGGDNAKAARMMQEQGLDPKQFLDTQASMTANATAEQGQGDKAREGMGKEFLAYNPDGKVNDALSASRMAAVQKIMPGADIMSAEGRSKTLPEMQMLAKIFDRASSNPQMGFSKINPMDPKGAAMDSMPNWKGGKLVRQGLAGMVTPGSSPNGYYISHSGGETPLGADLSERELEVIRHHLATGAWRGAPTNTQRGN